MVHFKDDNIFRLTGIYGEPDRNKRYETWQLIRHLSINNSLPWVLIDDMNNVCSQEDKRGGRSYPQILIRGFLDVLEDCNLSNLNLIGHPFTWKRGVGTEDWIEIRLDRAVSTPDFLNMFKDVTLTNLEVSTSDHYPLLLEFYKVHQVVKSRAFRFENAWLCKPMCQQLMADVLEIGKYFSIKLLSVLSSYPNGVKKSIVASNVEFRCTRE